MVVRVDEAVWLVAMNEKSVTVPCSADVDLENGKGMCKARKGRGRSRMSCSSGSEKSQSFTHDLDQLVGKSRSCVRCSCGK